MSLFVQGISSLPSSSFFFISGSFVFIISLLLFVVSLFYSFLLLATYQHCVISHWFDAPTRIQGKSECLDCVYFFEGTVTNCHLEHVSLGGLRPAINVLVPGKGIKPKWRVEHRLRYMACTCLSRTLDQCDCLFNPTSLAAYPTDLSTYPLKWSPVWCRDITWRKVCCVVIT